MEGKYIIYLEGQAAGWVNVAREGLYFRFCCQCDLRGEEVMRIWVRCDGTEIVLGVPIPSAEGFKLDTRLPVKRFAGGTPEFYLVGETGKHMSRFIPIRPEEPFSYIERLKDTFLVKKYGTLGINLPENF